MNGKLSEYVKRNYADSKADLFAVFIERCLQLAKENRYVAMITQHSWMFISSFASLRQRLCNSINIMSMSHLGVGTFEDLNSKVVQSVSFVFQKRIDQNYIGTYNRLFERNGLYEDNNEKALWLRTGTHRYYAQQINFHKIPGSPIAYWISRRLYDAFENGILLKELAHPKKGLATTDNSRFLRMWFEISAEQMAIGYKSKLSALQSGCKWFPLNKGGEFRKWYGNKQYLINWYDDGHEMKEAIIAHYRGGSYTKEIRSEDKYFQDSITWSALTTGQTSFRYSDYGALFDSAGSSMFPVENLFYLLAFLNSKVSSYILNIINPTLNYGAGSVAAIPILTVSTQEEIEQISYRNVMLSQSDWDSFETSWDFARHPLLPIREEQDNDE